MYCVYLPLDGGKVPNNYCLKSEWNGQSQGTTAFTSLHCICHSFSVCTVSFLLDLESNCFQLLCTVPHLKSSKFHLVMFISWWRDDRRSQSQLLWKTRQGNERLIPLIPRYTLNCFILKYYVTYNVFTGTVQICTAQNDFKRCYLHPECVLKLMHSFTYSQTRCALTLSF